MIKNLPAVSIVIPMYNTEQYIGECLDSILAQTFKDFEVIVVDDCSTDKGCEVVERYFPKFNKGVEKLQLIRLEKNSGGPSIPRNMGIGLSRGEYLMFVDSDDAITPNALKECYQIAKKFDADIVHYEKCYRFNHNTIKIDKKFLKVFALKDIKFVTKPTLMSYDLKERIQKFISYEFTWGTYSKVFRRDFIVENQLEFPQCAYGEDTILDICAFCLAKNIVQIPNLHYIYRIRQGSQTNAEFSIDNVISTEVEFIFVCIETLSKFFDKVGISKEHPEYKYSLLDFLINNYSKSLSRMYSQFPISELDSLIEKKLEEFEDKSALTAFFFGRMNIFHIAANHQSSLIQQMTEHIEKQNQMIWQLQQNYR